VESCSSINLPQRLSATHKECYVTPSASFWTLNLLSCACAACSSAHLSLTPPLSVSRNGCSTCGNCLFLVYPSG
ncbi:hypothetical protein BgiMline_023025, partial [Biomphalaria glabrata]